MKANVQAVKGVSWFSSKMHTATSLHAVSRQCQAMARERAYVDRLHACLSVCRQLQLMNVVQDAQLPACITNLNAFHDAGSRRIIADSGDGVNGHFTWVPIGTCTAFVCWGSRQTQEGRQSKRTGPRC
eukprot:6181818-Amphidinium_carterae.1